MSEQALRRWERRADPPLLAAAVLFIAAYAWPILDPGLPGWGATLCAAVNLSVWLAFAADFFVRLGLAERRPAFVRDNWLDVLTLLLPMLRPLRVLRAVLALNILGRRGAALVRGRVVAYVAAAVVVVGFVAALAVLDAERAAEDANITTFSDATWWAATTVTTVGYGDRFPVTTEGRIVAVGLMLTGIALLGVITAALASWFVERLTQLQAAEQATEDQVADLAAELRALRKEVRALRPPGGDVGRPAGELPSSEG